MDIDLLGYVRRELKSIGRAQWAALSARTGVPESTIEKIAYGFVEDPEGEQRAEARERPHERGRRTAAAQQRPARPADGIGAWQTTASAPKTFARRSRIAC
jgi:hypothetical protein